MTKKKWSMIDDDSLIGQRHGRWTITSISHRDKNGILYVKARCDCGTERAIPLL